MNSTNEKHELKNITSINYNAIDLFKFLGAILIFTIHIQPFSSDFFENADLLNSLTQNYICRLAVPFYFTASGFFLFRKTDIKKIDFSTISKYSLKILFLYGIWSIILYATPGRHLWYLKALVFASFILGLLFKFNVKLKYITILAIILYIIGLMGDAYYQPFKNWGENNLFGFLIEQYDVLYVRTRNGLFMGLIFVLIGAAFSQKRLTIKTIYSVIGFITSMCLLFVEARIVERYELYKDTNMYIFLVPTTIFLFDLLLKIKLKDRKIYSKLRVIGMLIYYSHLAVYTFVNQAFVVIKEYWRIDCTAFLYATSLVLTIAFAIFIEQISQKEKFKLLQHLYK